jgi:hypothetical protein
MSNLLIYEVFFSWISTVESKKKVVLIPSLTRLKAHSE